MRLPEATIKDAILHPERPARSRALDYVADCYSRDTDVMPRVIRAVETFGRENAFLHLYSVANLAQTEATVEWAVRELHRPEGGEEGHDRFFPALSRLLCDADPQPLVGRAEEIVRAPGFLGELIPAFQERLELLTWDADRCWKELEAIAARAAADPDEPGVDFDHVDRVVEALARRADQDGGLVLDLLGRDVKDDVGDPLAWMELFLIMLAGEMRLEQAVPLLVKKLRQADEGVSDDCVTALARIGSGAAAEAVTEGWQEAGWDFRLSATAVLHKVHSDTTVRRCLELLPQEKELDVKTYLAAALLMNFAPEGIEPVREMVLRRAYDDSLLDLMGDLVAAATVMGVTFPEYDVWKRQCEEKQAQVERRMKAMWKALQAPLPAPPSAPEPAPPREAYDYVPESKPVPFVREEK